MYCSHFSMLQMCNDCKYFVTGYCRRLQVETTVMDLLDSSLTEETSVLTEGEMSFTLYVNMNMADTRIMYCYFEPRTT